MSYSYFYNCGDWMGNKAFLAHALAYFSACKMKLPWTNIIFSAFIDLSIHSVAELCLTLDQFTCKVFHYKIPAPVGAALKNQQSNDKSYHQAPDYESGISIPIRCSPVANIFWFVYFITFNFSRCIWNFIEFRVASVAGTKHIRPFLRGDIDNICF